MKPTALFLPIAALLSLWGAPAAAQCVTVDPVIVPDIRLDPLDPTGAGQAIQPLQITFRRTGTDTTPLKVLYQIVDEDSPVQSRVGATAGPQIEWRSDDTSRPIGASRGDAYALLRSGTVALDADDASKQANLRLFLTDLREDLPAGVYREQFTVRYWCDESESSAPYEIPGIVTATVKVPNVLSANIAGASARGEIDFLDFAALSRSLSISVRSTGRYEVSARSVNGGIMLREGSASKDGANAIPYDVRFGGEALTLEESAALARPAAGLAGEQIPLEVVVQDVSSKRAGSYTDTLILTLTPVS